MRSLFFLAVCIAVLMPCTSTAQKRCDGGGKLASYLSGTIRGPAPSIISRVWMNRSVPSDVDPTSLQVLGEAIEALERRRPNVQRAADIAAGDWTGWRAKLMSREEFVRGFLKEVERRSANEDAYAAILQTAQAMLNRLDDLHGAAGGRVRPEDPHAMWRWDLFLRQPAAEQEIARLKALPDGEWLWGKYVMNRKTAIACALDETSAPDVLTAAVDESLFREPDLIMTLVAGRKAQLDFPTMAYLSGLLEYYVPNCTWLQSVDGFASVLRFQQAATQSALTQVYDLTGVVADSIEFATKAKAGKADAQALLDNYGCTSLAAVAFANGLVRTVQVDATVSSDSLFVQSCSGQGLTLKQCACLAELGRGVAPKIERTGYDRRSTIKSIVERNPYLGVQIGVQCGISDY